MNGAVHELLGQSRAMHDVRALVQRVGPGDLPVLIEGETGVGKELVARAIHHVSRRRGPLVPFNVCAIPEAMFEATLFGHTRGAFTGAHDSSRGFLQEAHDGTAFFDEIGTLSLANQGKLLRAIEMQQFRPVGAKQDVTSRFRVVVATNIPLAQLVAEGSFRTDLGYRLAGARIAVPPLRERREDVPQLLAAFWGEYHGGPLRLEGAAHAHLQQYDWPGNVRELRLLAQRLALLADEPVLSRELVAACLLPMRPSAASPAQVRADVQTHADSAAASALVSLLERHEYDVANAAASIGIHRSTLYRRLHAAGLNVNRLGRHSRFDERPARTATAPTFSGGLDPTRFIT
ncbi:MAG: sigma 54-interacting transcriptional regulator [Gemmatimonadaceae bacterium]|nr:sigma 54-interacting transcriptional regulator [Gemmatimonadaceae bacterium]